ncbi:hypothetical protein MPSEU_000619800 [Mayamaea pseudoterrestris]|nr:hypothetical protein MPSEU_000619800 [Mayamaea pseudoterrestris]
MTRISQSTGPIVLLSWMLMSFLSLADADVERQRLNFRTTNSRIETFKIVQITDIHLGETNAGEQDPYTFETIRTVLSLEQPGLIVLSGDMVTSEVIRTNADDYIRQLASVLEPFNVPWCLIFGNHDVAYYSETDRPARVGRSRIVRVDQASSLLSLTQLGPNYIFGESNYWLDIYASDDATIASRVLLLDSGGGMLPEKIDASQVDWFQATNDPNIATFCFQHLPTADMTYSSNKCFGDTMTGMIDPLVTDNGMMNALMDAQNVGFVAVGHNHGNSYCCPFENDNVSSNRWTSSSSSNSNMHYCFGRQSGYGGSPAFREHGARVYELGFDPVGGTIQWRSYVRTERGRSIDEYYPKYVS